MELKIKDGALWRNKFQSEEYCDVTSEAEKHLFQTEINTDEMVLGDLFEIFNKNQHLKAIFVEKGKKIFEGYDFGDKKIAEIMASKTSLEKFLDYYGGKTREDIKKEIDNILDGNKNDLVYLELEVVEDKINLGEENYGVSIDFIGVSENGKRYSMTLASVDAYYFLPVNVKFYEDKKDKNDERFFSETDGSLNTIHFFKSLCSCLNEMIFEKDRDSILI